MAVSGECWWEIVHMGDPLVEGGPRSEHHAWYQRSLLLGDFAPGRTPIAHYIVDQDGRCADPASTPACGTCGITPDVNDLDAIEVATATRGFFTAARAGARPWPKPSSDTGCWYCNGKPPVLAGMCTDCVTYVQEEAAALATLPADIATEVEDAEPVPEPPAPTPDPAPAPDPVTEPPTPDPPVDTTPADAAPSAPTNTKEP